MPSSYFKNPEKAGRGEEKDEEIEQAEEKPDPQG